MHTYTHIYLYTHTPHTHIYTLTLQKCGNDGLRSLEWRPRAVHGAQKAADHIFECNTFCLHFLIFCWIASGLFYCE